jgi:hypothetical protein
MKIKIVKRIGKTLDGVKIGEYINGNEYEVQDELAKIFIESGIAEEIKALVVDDESLEEHAPEQAVKAKRK